MLLFRKANKRKMIASGSLVSRMKPLGICLWARQRAIGKQPPYVGSVACSVWRKDRAFNRKHCDVHHIRHHCAPPDHGGLGAISQPPLAGEPQNKGRCTRHIYPWALSTVVMKVVLEGHTTGDIPKYFFRCSYWSEPQLFRWISDQHVSR